MLVCRVTLLPLCPKGYSQRNAVETDHNHYSTYELLIAQSLISFHRIIHYKPYCGFACCFASVRAKVGSKFCRLQHTLADSMLFGKALCTDKYRAMGGCFVYVVIYQLKEKRVSKVFIYEVFELLTSIRAVDSESEFSKDWLGRSECYLGTLRFKQKEPYANI